jgi:hypothetical protein
MRWLRAASRYWGGWSGRLDHDETPCRTPTGSE